jgi:hypothetical protein
MQNLECRFPTNPNPWEQKRERKYNIYCSATFPSALGLKNYYIFCPVKNLGIPPLQYYSVRRITPQE